MGSAVNAIPLPVPLVACVATLDNTIQVQYNGGELGDCKLQNQLTTTDKFAFWSSQGLVLSTRRSIFDRTISSAYALMLKNLAMVWSGPAWSPGGGLHQLPVLLTVWRHRTADGRQSMAFDIIQQQRGSVKKNKPATVTMKNISVIL